MLALTLRSSSALRDAAGPELLAALDAERAVVFAVDRALELSFLNPAWYAFALANGGQRCLEEYPVGASVQRAIPAVLRPFYEQGFGQVFGSGQPWEHVYQCPSSSQRRDVRMRATPVGAGHLIISNDILIEAPHVTAGTEPPAYVSVDGAVIQCAHCRRCRHVITGEWAWVPNLVERSGADVSHGLCDPCLELLYPAADSQAPIPSSS